MHSLYQKLPSVHALLSSKELECFPLNVRNDGVREALSFFRSQAEKEISFTKEDVVKKAAEIAQKSLRPSLKKVINVSGVILHTGLGRARLAKKVAERVYEVASHYSNLEIQDDGKRGDRQSHVLKLLKDLTGAEDAFVVNNCAAAVFLTIQSLCSGREVLLSYGQMVEIGGFFRMPDVIRQSGCRLVGVGSTNKTYLHDYENALTECSGAILRCHPSNFKLIGFTEEPETKALADFCRQQNLFFIDDIGNGCMINPAKFSIQEENTVLNSLKSGADIVLASGDKLLGGPQSGLILGKKEIVQKIKKHPVARAVRIDKLSLVALEETLRLYLEEKESEIPLWQAVSIPLGEVKSRAHFLANSYAGSSMVLESVTKVGSGSLPGTSIPTYCAVIDSESPEKFAKKLRDLDPPIFGRVQNGKVWLDPRTLDQDELKLVGDRLKSFSLE